MPTLPHPDGPTTELEQSSGSGPGLAPVSLEDAIEAHGGAVYAIAFRLSGDRGAAEEIAQDVFLELWRTRPEFASAEHARFWLRRVAVHRATDLLRRRMRRPVLVAADEVAEQQDGRLEGAGRELSSCLASRLEGLLQSLPEALRGGRTAVRGG